MRGALVVALSLALLVSGCGYGLVRYQRSLGDVKTVAVSTPRNDSYEVGVEFVVADALRREFLRRGGARVIESPDGADLVLSGRVLPIQARSRSFSSVAQALEYELTLEVELQAWLSDGRQVPIDRRATRESERYLASADAEALRKNREEAIRQAATLMAGRVYDALYETLVR